MSTWLLSIAALDASNTPVTLRFADGPYNDPAHVLWAVRLQQPALFKLRAFGRTLASPGRSGFGEAVLVNADGGLNYLVDYAVDGRQATLSLRGDDGVIRTALIGTVERLSFEGNQVSVRLRDPQERLNQPHPSTVYAGDNLLPNGVEGGSDIKGKQKPRVYGAVSNMQPVLVNTAKYIYQASDRAVNTISAVYVQGNALTNGGAYTSLADLQATPPAAAQFRSWQGYFRVGSVPTGTVSCDVTDTVTSLGSVFAAIAADAGATLLAADATTLNAVGAVGLRIADAAPTSNLLDELAASAGGYWAYDATGTLRARQLVAPGVPIITLAKADIIGLKRDAAGAGANGLPVWRVVVKADRVEDPQTDIVSTAIASAGRLSSPYREAVAESAATRTRHLLSDTLEIETALRSLSDAQTQADRLLALLSPRRDQAECTGRLSNAALTALDIGITARLETTDLGYSAGRNFVVLGYELDAQQSRATLDLWG